MANTEGMSDETVERLLLSPSPPPTRQTQRDSSKKKKKKNAHLQRRMELPLGDRPAAAAVRVGRPATTAAAATAAGPSRAPPPQSAQKGTEAARGVGFDEEEKSPGNGSFPAATPPSSESLPQEQPAGNGGAAVAVVGSVMERKSSAGRRRRRLRLDDSSPSKPASAVADDVATTDAPAGFPSVKGQPLGTLVRRSNSVNNKSIASSAGQPATGVSEDDSDRDGNAVLAQMSPEEIEESVREIEAALPPETVAFLKRRGQQRQQREKEKERPTTVAKPNGSVLPSHLSQDVPDVRRSSPEEDVVGRGNSYRRQELREKERMARILSTIRTHEELDAAYEAEILLIDDGVPPTTEKGQQQQPAIGGGDDDEFQVACDLVRSTARRQNLWAARKVAERLRHDYLEGKKKSVVKEVTSGNNGTCNWPYPVLLPVSLRCLLDAPPSSNGYVLHTYVLQALYYLLLSKSCEDHVVDVTEGVSERSSPTAIYQLYFMDDAIPTPRLGSCSCCSGPATTQSNTVQPLAVGDKGGGAAAYSTNSSSQSSQSDGEEFRKDPMWALLSRMRILPKLALLLRPGGDTDGSSGKLPNEALVAVCGILSMIAQRSPGAASAIVQHPTMLSDLLEQTFLTTEGEDDSFPNADLGIPVMMLLCTLTRQSRVAAQGLNVEVVLLRILAGPTSPADGVFQLQRWALVLWRTLLRYGLGLSYLSSLLSIAASHTALGPKAGRNYSLASDFYAAFACVVKCVRIGRRRITEEGGISKENIEILASAGDWLSSAVRNALTHVTISSRIFDEHGVNEMGMRYLASCLHFLDSFLVLRFDDETSGEFKSDDIIFSTNEAACINGLLSIVQTNSFSEAVMATVVAAFGDGKSIQGCLNKEATACYFLCSILSLTTSLCKQSHSLIDNLDDTSCQQLNVLVKELSTRLQGALELATMALSALGANTRSRRIWLHKTAICVASFLATTNTLGLDTTRAVVFHTIGRLDFGDEGPAAVLLSYDGLFQPSNLLTKAGASSSTSPLSTMLVRELCRTSASKKQLDHSFKRNGGVGITSSEMGPFGLDSLLSEADNQGSRADRDNCLLPLGELWLWQVLSGSVVHEQPGMGNIDDEPVLVISTSLNIIKEIECSDDAVLRRFVHNLSIGGKLYAVVNVCLHPEIVFRDERIQSQLGSLLDKYASTDCKEWVEDFIKACAQHSSTSARGTRNKELQAEEKQLSQLGRRLGDNLQALGDFVGDLCDAYVDYGAEFGSFTKCLRIFLLPSFPAKIRCDVLTRVRGLLHLFTLEEDRDKMASLLSRYILGGAPSVDGSRKDSPEVLDTISEIFASGLWSREGLGLVPCLAVALLARSLAISALEREGGGGLYLCGRRIERADHQVALQVFQTASSFLSSRMTASDLIGATLDKEKEDSFPLQLFSEDPNRRSWDRIFDFFRDKSAQRIEK